MAGRISTQSVSQYIEKSKVQFTRDMVKALTTLGYYAMMDAYKKREFKHRTRNLHDSYGSAVYVNGRLWTGSIRYVGGVYSRAVDPKTKKTGRQTLNDYLNSASFGHRKNEIILVVVAAMDYAPILESGGYGRDQGSSRPRIQVISVARDYIRQNYASAVAKVYAKYGIKDTPNARVISGNEIKTV